jgi:peptide/nickel transport system substrate-binding protein
MASSAGTSWPQDLVERPIRPWRLMLAAAVALAVLASACGSSNSPKAVSSASSTSLKPVNGGSLVVAVPAESDSWDPAKAEWAAAGTLVMSSVLEPLAAPNAQDGASPYLATSWIADQTFDRWQINLRHDVKFSDGTPFDANAVKLNFDTYVNGALTGQVLKPMIKDVRVLNPYAVVIDMKQPWAAFPSSYMTGAGAVMMAPKMINSSDQGATHPIGTGPFIFQGWTPGQSFKATRNPNYWQKGLPHLDSIEFRVITDDQTAVSSLQTGDVNMMLTQSAQSANQLAGSYNVVKNWDSEAVAVLNNTVASINGVPNPLSDIHARLALAYGTDQVALAKLEGAGVQTGTSPFARSSIWGMPDSQTGYVTYDPTKAKAELAKYEADSGQPALHISILTTPDQDAAKINQAVQAQWKKLGIKLDIIALQQPELIKRLISGTYETVYLHNYDYPDPDNEQVFWSSKTISGVGGVNINFSLYANPQIDKDLNQGRVSGYISQRQAAYRDLVKQLNAAALNIWLFRTPYSIIAAKNVHGLDQAKTVPFGNFSPKVWVANLWLSNS